MAIETYVQLHHCFDVLMAKVKKLANKEIDKTIISLELDKLTPEEQVKVLYLALQVITREIERFEKLEYYCFADQEQLIFKIYSNRILCNEKNEEQAIIKGYTFFEKYNKINQLLVKAKKQVPLFTLGHFLANKPSVVFYELNEQPYGTTDKDYQDIRTWQINQKRSCSQLEFYNLKEKFIAECKAAKDAEDLLQAEITQLENIYNHAADWTTFQLLTEFSKLKGLTGILMPQDKQGFHDLLCRVIKGDKLNGLLSPQFFEGAHQQINENMISPPPILLVSLLMYLRWLGDVLKENEELTNKRECSLDYLFFINFNQGFDLGAIAIDNCIKRLRKHKIPDEQYREKLILEYNKQREIYNELVYPDYFTFLEKKQKLKNCFIDDCLYCMNIDIPVEQLKRAIVLNEMITFLEDELRILNHNPFTTLKFQPFNRIQFAEIFCHLAPDSMQIKQLLKLLTKCTSLSHNKRIPVYFISEVMNLAFASLFKKAVIQYKDVIGMMTIAQRGYFLTEQLRDIYYMSRLCEIESSPMNPYYKHQKHIDKDELKSIQHLLPYKEPEVSRHQTNKEEEVNIPLETNMLYSTQTSNENNFIQHVSSIRQLKNKLFTDEMNELDDKKLFSFGYHPGPFELKPIMDGLKLKINIFKGDNAINEFMIAFTCRDLSQINTIFRLGCQTNQLKFVMEELEEYSTNFNPASIEKSGLFISKKGKPITANCITSSNTDTLRNKLAIKNIFLNKH